MKINFSSPNINVIFTTVSGDSFTVPSVELGGDIIALTTQKSLGSSVAGAFTIQMIARPDIVSFYKEFRGTFNAQISGSRSAYGVFRPMGLVDIYINDEEVMIGTIDSIEKSYSSGGGKPARAFTITGRDLGSFLIEHKVWWDKSMTGVQRGQVSGAVGGNYFLGGPVGQRPPHKIMEQIIMNWFVKTMTKIIPDKNNAFKFSGDIDNQIWDRFVTLGEDTPSLSIYDTITQPDPNNPGKFIEVDNTAQGPLATVMGPGALSKTTFGNFFPMSFPAWDYQGDLYNFVKTFSSSPFNELFVDTGGNNISVPLGHPRQWNGSSWEDVDLQTAQSSIYSQYLPELSGKGLRSAQLKKGKAYLIFRPTPYDDSYLGISPTGMPSLLTMQDLPENVITDEDIVQKNLKLSRDGMNSLFFVKPSNGIIQGSAGSFIVQPEYDWKNLARYGYNPIEVQLEGIDLFSNEFGNGDIKVLCENFQKKLMAWYTDSDKQLSGSFTIRGKEKIRIGQVLRYNRTEDGLIEDEYEEGYYYIVGVSHTYQYGKNFMTSLNVERGISQRVLGTSKDGRINASEVTSANA